MGARNTTRETFTGLWDEERIRTTQNATYETTDALNKKNRAEESNWNSQQETKEKQEKNY